MAKEHMEGSVFHKPLFDQINEEKRLRIINAAIGEFSRKGLDGANINIIARQAGVSVGSIYQYFPGKEALYLMVVQFGFDTLQEALLPILEAETGFMSKIELIIDTVFSYSREYRSLTRLYNRFTSESSPELAARLADRIESFTACRYAALLQSARQEGILNSGVDEHVLAFCLDSLFLVLQFSLSGEYYSRRMQLYLGEKLSGNQEELKQQLLMFIRQALGIRQELKKEEQSL